MLANLLRRIFGEQLRVHALQTLPPPQHQPRRRVRNGDTDACLAHHSDNSDSDRTSPPSSASSSIADCPGCAGQSTLTRTSWSSGWQRQP
jgi:hypothetical protein